jgi:hypothetical protein
MNVWAIPVGHEVIATTRLWPSPAAGIGAGSGSGSGSATSGSAVAAAAASMTSWGWRIASAVAAAVTGLPANRDDDRPHADPGEIDGRVGQCLAIGQRPTGELLELFAVGLDEIRPRPNRLAQRRPAGVEGHAPAALADERDQAPVGARRRPRGQAPGEDHPAPRDDDLGQGVLERTEIALVHMETAEVDIRRGARDHVDDLDPERRE